MLSYKVLVVDDQASIRMLLEEVLGEDGYELYFAGNGFEALEIVKQYSPHLVLLDRKIPGMDGLDILRKIKEIHPDMAVFMMTAFEEQSMLEEATQLGATKFLPKPFDIDELRKEVSQFINTHFALKRIGSKMDKYTK